MAARSRRRWIWRSRRRCASRRTRCRGLCSRRSRGSTCATALARSRRGWVAAVDVPQATARDLSFVSQLLPAGTGLTVAGGRGTVEAHLTGVGVGAARGSGKVEVKGERVDVTYEGARLTGDVSAVAAL